MDKSGVKSVMNSRTHYQQIQRATVQLAGVTLVFLAMTVTCALLGFRQGVISLRGATGALAYALAVLFILWTLASVFRMVRRQFNAKRSGAA